MHACQANAGGALPPLRAFLCLDGLIGDAKTDAIGRVAANPTGTPCATPQENPMSGARRRERQPHRAKTGLLDGLQGLLVFGGLVAHGVPIIARGA